MLVRALVVAASVLVAAPALAQDAPAAASPAVPAAEYAARRAKVLAALGADGLLVLRGQHEDDVEKHERWRQHSDFYYLTGFDEPDAILVLNPRGRRTREVLFVPARNPDKEAWDGRKTAPGAEGAAATGLPGVLAREDFDALFPELLAEQTRLFLAVDLDDPHAPVPPEIRALDALRAHWQRLGVDRRVSVHRAAELIHPMRLVKSDAEIAVFHQACTITARAIVEAMRSAAPGQGEGELQAVVEYVFRRLGAERTGYPSIVGAGPNSCVLHYRHNTGPTRDGDLVLMDVGAEYRYYTADVTRTFPVNGRFSPAQREIYEVVWRAQQAAFAVCKPGSTLTQVHQAAQKVIADAGWGGYFFHGTSHWIGLDVHDVGGSWSTVLAPGMIFSVEPGIYIPEGSKCDRRYWNIGVRIEDDVVVTADGYRNLSADVPSDVASIERIMAADGIGNRPVGEMPGDGR